LLFDINPKTRREDFYNRERELEELRRGLELDERFIVIYGIRRIGKSSLLNILLTETKSPYIILDIKKIYFEHGSIPRTIFLKNFLDRFVKQTGMLESLGFRIKDVFGRIKGIQLMEIGVEINPVSTPSITDIFERIDDWCSKKQKRFIIALDEAQYLRFGGGIRYDGIIAWAVDNLPNITFILTGSEIGMLRDFLKMDDAQAPLYGRYRREIALERFSREESIDFLRKGFNELKINVSKRELDEVVDKLDGIVGWLTYYGYYRGIRKIPHREALTKVFEEGTKIIMSELEKLITPSRKRYLAILEAVSHGVSRFNEIKAYVYMRTGPINNARLTTLIKNLLKYNYLEKLLFSNYL